MEICPRDDCFGCGLCAYSCPKQCITMKESQEGFIEPIVDEENCIGCNRCKKQCPSNTKYNNEIDFTPKYYLAWHVSDEIRYKSSSGAVFSAIAIPMIEAGGYVVGAVYDDAFLVHHEIVNTIDGIEHIRKSKYLQSNIVKSYERIQKALSDGTPVLFTGTPCQCAAMQKMFGNNENFFCCDVICHGVQSPKVFSDALRFMEKKFHGKCVSVDFRSKTKGWANACTTEVIFDNGKKINKRANDIPIGAGFLKNLSIRKSCEDCVYRTIERSSDITIGDFWAIRDEPHYLKKYKDLGFSSIIVNTPKGESLLHSGSNFLHLEARTMEQVKYQNNPLYKQFTPNIERASFFSDYYNHGFEYVWKYYLKPQKKETLRWRVIATARKLGLLKIYQKIRGVS